MKSSDLGEFLRKQTGMELVSQGDGLESPRTEIVIQRVPSSATDKIISHISDFYKQQGYVRDDKLSGEGSLFYKKPGHTKAVVFSYDNTIEQVFITSLSIRGKVANLNPEVDI
ncbi:hypothetical protein J4218_04950 [Candidatus Pacearchaeota archaeon]|nr:hypothetical protein [Candidatus Pacearchaeota archaeon]